MRATRIDSPTQINGTLLTLSTIKHIKQLEKSNTFEAFAHQENELLKTKRRLSRYLY